MAHATQSFVTCPFTIYRDSREQAPWTFVGLEADADQKRLPIVVPVEWHSLGNSMGDYTIAGMEDADTGWRVAIERKSVEDLYGTVLGERARFVRELENLNRMRYAAVVVEGSWWDLGTYDPERWNEAGFTTQKRADIRKSVRRSILSWSIDYPTVHWWLMPGRAAAEACCFRLLSKFWEKNHEAR